MLGNQDKLTICGLLGQGQGPDIYGQEIRIGNCWNATTQVSPARGCGTCGDSATQHPVTLKQLVAQLLSQLEIAEVQHTCHERELEQQVRGDMSLPSPPEIGYQGPPVTRTYKFNEKAADLRWKIMNKMGTSLADYQDQEKYLPKVY